MERKTIVLIAVVAMLALAGCAGSPSTETGTSNSSEDFETFTQPADGTDKVWSCIAWEDYNGHKMECELVNSTETGY
jgi:ABC-type glycerol-3-phosphate transport system substrate-binding protein